VHGTGKTSCSDRPTEWLFGGREILLPREAWWLLPRERQRRSIGQEERGHGLVSIMHVFPPKRTKRMYEITGRHIRWLGHLALDGWMHGSHLLLLIRRQKKNGVGRRELCSHLCVMIAGPSVVTRAVFSRPYTRKRYECVHLDAYRIRLWIDELQVIASEAARRHAATVCVSLQANIEIGFR
jgi:hypothetical protein